MNHDLNIELRRVGLKRGGGPYPIGKVIGGSVYVHRQYENQFPQRELEAAKQKLPKGFEYNVVKYTPKLNSFTFIISKDFDTDPEPSVNGGITVKPNGNIQPFKDAGWIYHHKWQFVGDDYTGFDVEESKRRSLDWYAIPNVEKAKIGQRAYWNANVVPKIHTKTFESFFYS